MPAPTSDIFEVLVVDDEAETREVLSEFCRTLGLTVTAADDGRSAITAIRRAPAQFRVVLTDIWMRGADGFEVLKAARDANPSSYVVMITGYATLDSALRAVREARPLREGRFSCPQLRCPVPRRPAPIRSPSAR